MNEKMFQLCESITEEEMKGLDRERYKANEKYDGTRVMTIKKGTDIFMFGRRGEIYNERFSEIFEELSKIPGEFIIDGEVISSDGLFNTLQRRALTQNKQKIEELKKIIPIKYMVFDILSINGNVITNEKLKDRIVILNNLFSNVYANIELVEYGEIDILYEKVKKECREGIVVKDMDSFYESRRSKSWLKRKLFKEHYLTITGYSINNKGIRATDNDNNCLQIAGTNGMKVKNEIDTKGYANILIQYLEKTELGRYRFISFRGLK